MIEESEEDFGSRATKEGLAGERGSESMEQGQGQERSCSGEERGLGTKFH